MGHCSHLWALSARTFLCHPFHHDVVSLELAEQTETSKAVTQVKLFLLPGVGVGIRAEWWASWLIQWLADFQGPRSVVHKSPQRRSLEVTFPWWWGIVSLKLLVARGYYYRDTVVNHCQEMHSHLNSGWTLLYRSGCYEYSHSLFCLSPLLWHWSQMDDPSFSEARPIFSSRYFPR